MNELYESFKNKNEDEFKKLNAALAVNGCAFIKIHDDGNVTFVEPDDVYKSEQPVYTHPCMGTCSGWQDGYEKGSKK